MLEPSLGDFMDIRADELVNLIYEKSREAFNIIKRYVHRTPVDLSRSFSQMTEYKVFLKYENLQKTGSFKVRGALFKVYNLMLQGVRGVVAASAGNHAQGVAFAAQIFGLRAVIVMPLTASIAKVEATRSYGAEVILHGTVYDEAETFAKRISEEQGLAFVHPFDDVDVIAGQATIAWELLEQLEDFDAIVVPIGGGGLVSGIISVLKRVKPEIKIIGVEAEHAPKMYESIRSGKPVTISPKPSIADGLVTKKPGEITFAIVSRFIDDIVTVSEEEIAMAIHLLLERGKVLAEGAGAASLAALISGKVKLRKGMKVVALVTGGNIDATALYRVLLRGLLNQGRIARLRGEVLDVPGSLERVLSVIASHRGNVLDIKHDRYELRASPWHAVVEILVEVPSRKVAQEILRDLKVKGFDFELID